jgi:hypothetical protein
MRNKRDGKGGKRLELDSNRGDTYPLSFNLAASLD